MVADLFRRLLRQMIEVGHPESLGQDGGGTWRPVVPRLPVGQPDRLLGEPALGNLGVEPAQQVLPRNRMAMNRAAKERVPVASRTAYGSTLPSRGMTLYFHNTLPMRGRLFHQPHVKSCYSGLILHDRMGSQ